MGMRLEVVAVAVSDVDGTKRFCDGCGFGVDLDDRQRMERCAGSRP